ncbi:T9SS type A sorting domain-containing protein [Flavobacterium sp. I-SCBP12n]|uniref:T9SS type A sorting domain-containing protein n=1 Tax=Flavobacterium pygoscelis TaxID=2893176 RepID=A0A9X1XSW1_9FLAO|nr:T9SS type A sorting domain-containing protein [Flavobacterium pygoscelis]MCK8141966.1 T9SS type A sorting domain-containing protein [Flavobacterium pygoscelis]
MYGKILKKSLLVATGFLLQNSVNAQMFVSADTYVYASNEVIYIGQQLELNAASSFLYLRDTAQLVQGSAGTSTNKGLGSLSVFQEGSVNDYQYNYWCSPVGGSDTNSGNSPFGINQLNDVLNVTQSTPATILPMNNYNGTSVPLAIAPYWVTKLTTSTEYSSWIDAGAPNSILAGEGFTMKGTSGTNTVSVNGVQNNPGSRQRYDFRGKPNDGTISIPVKFENYTLTGNPYPSTIDLSAFLLTETNCSGTAYFWEQDNTVNSHFLADYKGGYGTFVPVDINSLGIYTPATFYSYDGSGNAGGNVGTGNYYQRRNLPIGQGFLIDGKVDGVVEMKNSYRTFVRETPDSSTPIARKSDSKAKKNTNPFANTQSVSGIDYSQVTDEQVPQIRINTLLNNKGVRQLALGFVPQATDGIDHGMDGGSSSQGTPADIYFLIEDAEFVINVLNFDNDKKIPIGFRNAKEASYKITVNEIINFTQANTIFLHDKVNNQYYDIKNDFHELILPPGENNTQFEITFKTDKSLGVEEAAKENFMIYQNNENQNLVIDNPLLMDLDVCGLYDVAGKVIFTKKDIGNQASYKFATSGLVDGIYIVKMVTKDKQVVGKKIIIKN